MFNRIRRGNRLTRVIEEFDLSIAQKLAHPIHTATTPSYDRRTDNERQRVVNHLDL